MEYRVHITHGSEYTDDLGDQLLDALIDQVPDWGPVLSANLADTTITITLALDAPDILAALSQAIVPARHALELAGVNDHAQVCSVEIELVRDDQPVAA